MLATCAIGQTAISADAGRVTSPGGIVIDEEVGEGVGCEDLCSVALAAILFLAENSGLADLASAPGTGLEEQIFGTVGVIVTYAAGGGWVAEPSAPVDWTAVPGDQGGWVIVAASGDFWIRQ
jgi:hypothetical protein